MTIIDSGIYRSHRKSKMFISICLMIVLTSCIVALSLLQPQESNDTSSEPPVHAGIMYTPHAPIFIDGNVGFLGPNSSTGISWGNGTVSNPYIIEGWIIDIIPDVSGIEIRNSDVYFIIRDCYVYRGDVLEYYNIHLFNCTNGIICNNICRYTGDSIFLEYSCGNTLFNNTCLDGPYTGISLKRYSSNNILSNNTCLNNIFCITVGVFCINNILSNNTCSSDGYGIFVASPYNTLYNNICTDGNFGIYLWQTSYINVSNNICTDNYDGIHLYGSSYNNVSNNICSSNLRGIYLTLDSHNNEITLNQICDNLEFGIVIVEKAYSNMIWNNTFIGNNGASSIYDPSHIQAKDDATNNWWNSTEGYGNNWSDWQSPDYNFDGIVDYPYNISGSAGAKDYYPHAGYVGIPEPPIFILAGIMIAVFLMFGRIRKK